MPTEDEVRGQIVAVRAQLGRVLAAGQRLRGCTEQDIKDLCAVTGIGRDELPAGYSEYLAVAGRAAGRVAEGSAFRWPAPLTLTGDAHALASGLGLGKGLERVPGRFLAFLGHQGHSYLLLEWDDDGERVTLLDEATPFLHVPTDPVTFAEWLEDEVQSMLSRLERTPDPFAIPPPFE